MVVICNIKLLFLNHILIEKSDGNVTYTYMLDLIVYFTSQI